MAIVQRARPAEAAAYDPPTFDDLVPTEAHGRHRFRPWSLALAATARCAGRALLAVEDWNAARRVFERALRIRPDDGRAWFAVGVCCERGGPVGIVNDQRVGLIRGRTGDPTSAIRAFDHALRVDPRNPNYLVRRGVALAASQQYDEALSSIDEALRLRPSDADAHLERGRVIAAVAAGHGAFVGAELDSMNRSWQRTLAIEPTQQSARYHLVRSLVSIAQWAPAAIAALAPTAWNGTGPEELTEVWKDDGDVDTQSAIESVLSFLAGQPELRSDLTNDWWYVLHARVHALGGFGLAYEVKSRLARKVSANPSSLVRAGVTGYLDIARALSYLGDDETALDHLDRAASRWLPWHERAAFIKLRADLRLRLGDPEPIRAALVLHEGANTNAAEDHFAELVTGRRVAIVGPGTTTELNGAEIDSFDTVVRTKYRQPSTAEVARFAGARTEISYYSDSNSKLLRDDIERALAAGELQMAVFRPSAFDHAIPMIHRPGDLRYVPSQDSSTFESTRFAVQRIVYDVIRYRPAQLKVFNIDFFLSKDAYVDGYTDEATQVFRARDLQLVRTSAAHDLKLDFEFVQRLTRQGLLDVDERVRQLVELPPDDYLKRLERRGGGPPLF